MRLKCNTGHSCFMQLTKKRIFNDFLIVPADLSCFYKCDPELALT